MVCAPFALVADAMAPAGELCSTMLHPGTPFLVERPCEVAQTVPWKIFDLPRQNPPTRGLCNFRSTIFVKINFWDISSKYNLGQFPGQVVGMPTSVRLTRDQISENVM